MSSVNGSSWLRQGQKVVCINARGLAADGMTPLTVRGVYTIREVRVWAEFGTGLLLEEVSHAPEETLGGTVERGYKSIRFRPLVTKTQAEDIALFLSIANEAEKPLVNLTDALNLAWLAYGVEE